MDHFPFYIKRDIFFFLSIDNLKNDEYEKRMHPLSPQLSSKKRLLRFDFFFFFFQIQTRLQHCHNHISAIAIRILAGSRLV